ncbi:MAG: GNAT family N-acetyltransferase [Lentisphaerae bacterium]|nr:GNAT family N-acetyltransferase [Lentisphaerota bacterium]
MTEIRTYRAGDENEIVALWNQRVAGCFATGPLTVETFRADVVAKHHFEPDGLILAFSGGRLAAWAHAGFKSADNVTPDFRAGTISMLAVADVAAGQAAVGAALHYLFKRGAKHAAAFTIDFPNTPFYNGLYGGEKAGMDETHPNGWETLARCGFKPAAGAIIMVCELDGPDALPPAPPGTRLSIAPWNSQFTQPSSARAYGIPEKIRQAEVLDESGKILAHMEFWHLERYNRATGDRMAVVSHVYASDETRGGGTAAFLQAAVHRELRKEGARRMALGAGSLNGRAVRFYQKIGYRPLRNAFQFYLDFQRYGDFS